MSYFKKQTIPATLLDLKERKSIKQVCDFQPHEAALQLVFLCLQESQRSNELLTERLRLAEKQLESQRDVIQALQAQNTQAVYLAKFAANLTSLNLDKLEEGNGQCNQAVQTDNRGDPVVVHLDAQIGELLNEVYQLVCEKHSIILSNASTRKTHMRQVSDLISRLDNETVEHAKTTKLLEDSDNQGSKRDAECHLLHSACNLAIAIANSQLDVLVPSREACKPLSRSGIRLNKSSTSLTIAKLRKVRKDKTFLLDMITLGLQLLYAITP